MKTELTSLPKFAFTHPHSVAAIIILGCLLAFGAVSRMPTDIFPDINIPVVNVVWTYNGMNAEEMQNRILIQHERQMASLVDDTARIEAKSYTGVGIIKVRLHDGADVTRALGRDWEMFEEELPAPAARPVLLAAFDHLHDR